MPKELLLITKLLVFERFGKGYLGNELATSVDFENDLCKGVPFGILASEDHLHALKPSVYNTLKGRENPKKQNRVPLKWGE